MMGREVERLYAQKEREHRHRMSAAGEGPVAAVLGGWSRDGVGGSGRRTGLRLGMRSLELVPRALGSHGRY